jgi:hypothetical protein
MAVGQRAVPGRVPGPHRRRRLRHRDRRGPLSRRVPHRASAEPVRFDLRPRLRGSVRNGVPAGHGRCAGRYTGPQAFRHRKLGRGEFLGEHCLARGPRSRSRSDPRLGWRRGRRTGRAECGVRASSRRPPGHRVRSGRPAGRNDGARHPEYRLARGLIAREIDAILELGIDAELGFRVGRRDAGGIAGAPRVTVLAVGTGRGAVSTSGPTSTAYCAPSSSCLNVNQGFARISASDSLSWVAAMSPSMPPAPPCVWPPAGRRPRRYDAAARHRHG